jgi:hypothetical protein
MEQPSGRLHSLDNLRAVMLWLGIVLHVALNHLLAPTDAAPWRDRATTGAADLIFLFIHTFRMPVFFIMAGYFVALLVNKRGYEGMLGHRLRRLALPFVLFWPVLFIAISALVMIYLHIMAYGAPGFDRTLIPKQSPNRAAISILHLWFIYYLMWFCVLTAGVGRIRHRIPARLKSGIERIWELLGSRWWGFAVLALPLAIVGSSYPAGLVAPNGSFIPNIRELIHGGMFYVSGWYLYRHQNTLLPLYARAWWKYALAGFIVFMVSLALFGIFANNLRAIPHIEAYIAFVYYCTSWLWSFALIGIFVRYLSRQNAALQYVSESSYWVYMVHMLGTIGFGALIYNLPIGAFGKMDSIFS